MTVSPTSALFSIPPSAPFFETFVDALLAGQIRPVSRPSEDPFALADVTVLVPTRRAVRGLEDVFLDRLGGKAAILPRIELLGVSDEDELTLSADFPIDALLSETSAPPISSLKRQMAMTRLVYGWAQSLAQRVLPADQLRQIAIPSSPADAAWLAGDLLSLMDQVANEGGDWEGLQSLVPADYAGYWELTLTFLRIVTEQWPLFLSESGVSDTAEFRNAQLRLAAERYDIAQPSSPVIVLGATSTARAAIDLMRTICALPQGALVLPGLDFQMSSEGWASLGDGGIHPYQVGHPQTALKRILDGLGAYREDVRSLEPARGILHPARDRLISEVMRPSAETAGWIHSRQQMGDVQITDALNAVTLLEANNSREEALAIALKLRQVIEENDSATAALVTPDRLLARRVAGELLRWKIPVDDSAGRPLAQTPPGILSRLVIDLVHQGTEPKLVLAVLRHPLVALGLDRRLVRRAARLVELALLRGPRVTPGLEALIHAFRARREAVSQKSVRVPDQVIRASDEDWDRAHDCLMRLADIFAPLENLLDQGEVVPFHDLLQCQRQVLEGLCLDEAGTTGELYEGDAGDMFRAFLDECEDAQDVALTVAGHDYHPLFDAFMARYSVRSRLPGHPRVHIWGSLEARLQTVSCIVLGGLNEGVWPGETRSDPWLSRPMKRDMTLDPPERRVGLAAHDFIMASGMQEVVYTRALRTDGAPSVASRWLQRLEAFAGSPRMAVCRARGAEILDWARRLDEPDQVRPIERPAPCPPVDDRPDSLSITEIETLIRDPYAIYARHVLNLKPIRPIGELPGAAEKGTIIHEALADFAASWDGPLTEAALTHLLDCGEAAFETVSDFPEVCAFWWPRFERVARWVVEDWEVSRVLDLDRRHAEIPGRLSFDAMEPPFVLHGRADRVDEKLDGTVSVVDFKTGQPSTARQVESMLAPQLPLEALIAMRGGFKGLGPRQPSEIAYVRLSGGMPAGEVKPANKEKTPEQLALEAEQRLLRLIAHFRQVTTPYLSRARVERENRFAGDYDHLARVKEWMVAGEQIDD
ncbi:double-strand break repair protein AddB [Coralliovum pocilloporae]|uniref:double-strand break repair protein AddB n=1 Tax=Coralliovum pocilloporae TaxID=3066369 RepID=UPI003306FD9A